MKNKLFLIHALFASVSPTIALTGCSKSSSDRYVAIPTKYLNISDNGETLEGFKSDIIDTELESYDTLQIPSTVVSVAGFQFTRASKAYNYIKNIIYSSNSKWTTIKSNAFSSLPNIKKIVLPNTLSTVEHRAFFHLKALNIIDLSNIENIKNVIKTDCFVPSESTITEVILNGTIYVKYSAQIDEVKQIFENNNWLKGWTIKIKS